MIESPQPRRNRVLLVLASGSGHMGVYAIYQKGVILWPFISLLPSLKRSKTQLVRSSQSVLYSCRKVYLRQPHAQRCEFVRPSLERVAGGST